MLGMAYSLAENKFKFKINMKFNIKGSSRQKKEVELMARELEQLKLEN